MGNGSGWISLHRKIADHWLFQEERKFSKFEAWIDLLLSINHKDGKKLIQNEVVEVKRGQHITSIRKLCNRWGWSNTKVKNFLSLLESENMILVKNDSKKTLITVVNWDLYQTPRQEKTTQKRQRKNENFPETPQKNDGENTQEIQQYQGLPPSGDDKKRHESDAETTQKHTNNNDNNENKYNPRKRAKRIYDDDSPYMKMAIYFKDRVLSWKPNAKVPNDLNKWADDFRKLHELDKRTKQEIKDVIDWATSDSFWQANILSPGKLRKQFDTLQAQMSRKVIKMPEKPMSYWEEKQRREEELERKRLAERDKQMKVQRFIEETGLHPMKHPDLLRDYLEGRVSLAELKERKWGS